MQRHNEAQKFLKVRPESFRGAKFMVELLDHVLRIVLGEERLKQYLLEKHSPEEVRSYQEKQYEWVKQTCSWISSTKENLHSIKHGLNKNPYSFVEILLIASERILLIVLAD